MAEVESRRDGPVLTLTLNRPDVLNAMNSAMHAALAEGLRQARDPEVRAVVVTGAGRGFCVGQDAAELQDLGDVGALLRSRYHPAVLGLRALEKPVIAAVNGPAAGAGLALALACDLRLAAESATFVPAFIGLGLVPDSGCSFFAARLLGPGRAFEWLSRNRRLSAAEAREWGLVAEVVPDGELPGRAAALAAEYAAGPTRALVMTRRLLDRALSASLEDQLQREAELQTAAARTADFAEGLAAFREKRPARFLGR